MYNGRKYKALWRLIVALVVLFIIAGILLSFGG